MPFLASIFPVRVEDGALLVDVAERSDRRQHFLRRLGDGLERDIRLVIAKSVIALLDQGGDPREVMRAGLEFGVRNRRDGWGAGLTILTCMANLASRLHADDRPRAMYHGLAQFGNLGPAPDKWHEVTLSSASVSSLSARASRPNRGLVA